MSQYFEEQSEVSYTFIELCEVCHVEATVIIEMVDFTIVEPKGESEASWVFSSVDILRLKKAIRIHHDLEVNVAGVAMALELMDELKHYKKKAKDLEVLLNKLA